MQQDIARRVRGVKDRVRRIGDDGIELKVGRDDDVSRGPQRQYVDDRVLAQRRTEGTIPWQRYGGTMRKILKTLLKWGLGRALCTCPNPHWIPLSWGG